jgi:hypothetical protein
MYSACKTSHLPPTSERSLCCLQVTLFAPGSSLSAAAALDALKFFALAHQVGWVIHVAIAGGRVCLLISCYTGCGPQPSSLPCMHKGHEVLLRSFLSQICSALTLNVQADFDVRWCKGPIGTLLLRPLAEHCMQVGWACWNDKISKLGSVCWIVAAMLCIFP